MEEFQWVELSAMGFVGDLSVGHNSGFAEEELPTDAHYPPEYQRKSLQEQIGILCEWLKIRDGGFDERFADQPLPEGAEGWFACPRWRSLIDTDGRTVKTYNEALDLALSALSFQRLIGADGNFVKTYEEAGRFSAGRRNKRFHSHRVNKTGPEYFREGEHKVRSMHVLAERQTGNFLVFPAQFGFLHRGRSARRAAACYLDHEFGLGVFEGACMTLTHPERFVRQDQLHVKFPGDENNAFGIGEKFLDVGMFVWARYEQIYPACLRFTSYRISSTGFRSGCATGFIP